MNPDQPNYLYQLQKQIDSHFNLEEIEGLTFDLEIDYEHLAGNTKPTKINSLLLYLAKDGELERLIDILKTHRQNVVWSALSLPIKEQQQKDARFIGLSLPSNQQIAAHLQALSEMSEFAKWAEASAEEHYIPGQSKMLPLLASPYDNLGSQQTALITTMQQQARLLVLGEPGMGKTVALQRMVSAAAKEGERIPVFVRLQQFRGDLQESVRVVLNATGQLQLPDSQAVQLFLREVPCLLLLDGLNEIPGRWREGAMGAIGDLLTEFPQQHTVITSRVQDELWKKLHKGEIVTTAVVVQRISDAQARAYLQAHMGENGQVLYEQLNDRLRGLVHTPLFLWMMKEAGLSQGELPRNQGELIASFVNQALQREEKIPSALPVAVKKQALTHLAFTVQGWHQLDFTYRQAQEIIAKARLDKEADAILQEVLRHGLLEREEEHLRFMHQSIQEYFVAVSLNAVLGNERETAVWQRKLKQWAGRNELASWLKDDWWAESFLQLAGLTQHNSWLVQEILKVKPWLAFWCMLEGRQVDSATQSLVEAKTVAQFRSRKSRQRLNALRELVRFENPRIVPYLIQAISDEDKRVGNLAMESLVRLGAPAVTPLLEIFNHESVIVRSRVAMAMSLLGEDPRPGVGVMLQDGLPLPDIAWGGEVPAGTYRVGGDKRYSIASFEEKEVVLKRPFQLARYPITYAQFQCFIDAPDVTDGRWWAGMPADAQKWSDQTFPYANHPRENVSWYQAIAFCRWLSDKLGYEVDLPHEFEWEAAARYPDNRFYPWGNEIPHSILDKEKANTGEWEMGQTTAVGLYPDGAQNQLGLYDMSGNVEEWCRNQYDDPDNTAVDDSKARRVVRGGTWAHYHNSARAASRNGSPLDRRDDKGGFRLARRLSSQ